MISAFFGAIRDAIRSLFYRPDLLQVAALCWRRNDGDIQLLLICSLDSKRWMISEGWPMRGKTLAEAARIEAWEEAGVKGHISSDPIGSFRYHKRRATGLKQSCTVYVFALHVTSIADNFPEVALRNPRWMSKTDAIKRLRQPALQALIQDHLANFE